jgi:transposase
MAAFTWRGCATCQDVANLGPLALFQPLLQQLDVAAIIDRHLPPDPQLEYSHGEVLQVLLAARLCQPTALVNVADWAARSGADILANIPVEKLNDDRLGRALDAFFEQRHSILGSITAQVLQQTELTLDRLHFDPTHLVFTGAYASSTARPDQSDQPADKPLTSDRLLPPAHICHGYNSDRKMIQMSQLAIVDDLGAVPVLAHCLDGNQNGHPAIRETFQLAQHHLNLPDQVLLISDRGTCSVEHIARLYRHGHQVLCPGQWQDYRGLYDAHLQQLDWKPASYLSVEQKRRRSSGSKLPRERYELAVLKHSLVDPTNGRSIPARLIFVYSSADERACREHREQNLAKIQAGLTDLQAKLLRGHPQCTTASVTRQIVRLLGKKGAARYFSWRFVPLTPEEQTALPQPKAGHCMPTVRLEFQFDAAAVQTDEHYDGLAVLVTTAPLSKSANLLFRYYREQNYVESLHHQAKTPLAVTPVFLKSPTRVEALVCLIQIALQVNQVLERLYRQRMADEENRGEQRMTAERLIRAFGVYGLLIEHNGVGRSVYTTRLTARQKQILERLGFPTPEQILDRLLLPEPIY